MLALCGGVGGAKLALGLSSVLDPARLTIAVNTGDDFEHLGLRVCPDIDTVVYTLSGLADPVRGWGVEGDTPAFMETVARLGGETWFQLGDRDLAMHVLRTARLAGGETLSQITADLAVALRIRAAVAPMSDQPVRTWLDTDAGPLPFQTYFVRERCQPRVRAIRFEGAAAARPSPAFEEALARKDLAAIVVCPSNPYLSVDPILAVPGVREALAAARTPRIAVSPIIGGAAVKGPTAKLMTELGLIPGSCAIAEHYRGLIDGLILDVADAADATMVESRGTASLVAPTLMKSLADRKALATAALTFARALAANAG